MSVLIKGYEKPKRCVECMACFAKMCSLKENEKCPLDGVPEWCPMVEIEGDGVLVYKWEMIEEEI